MDQQERDQLMLYRDAIEDAGIARQARADALGRLERHFQGQTPDSIDVHSFVRNDLRRQAPHFWEQGRPGTPGPAVQGSPPSGASAREQRKALKRALTPAEVEDIKSLPSTAERMTVAREWEQIPLGTPHPSAADTARGQRP